MKKIIVDMHSHVGKDIFHGDSKLCEYIEYARKNNVNIGLIMPVPSPCIELSNPNIRYMYWKYLNGQMQYFGKENPYLEVNYQLYHQIKEINDTNINLFFIPMIHPIMDDINYITELIELTDPLAIKIHGIASGVGPNDISDDLIQLLKSKDLPLIVHTDCDNGLGSISMQYIRNINTAFEWANFFIKNNLRGVLNHGASLDERVFNLVNKYSEYLKIAVGPDLVACKDDNRLFITCNSDSHVYYQILKDYVDYKNLLFDIDYNWNRINTTDDDYSIVDRVVDIWGDNSDYILGTNALTFLPQMEKKLVKKYERKR